MGRTQAGSPGSPQRKGGVGGQVLGADDPLSNAPNLMAMMFTMGSALVGAGVLVVACLTTHWFVADTGAHAGLLQMSEKDWKCGDSCPDILRDQTDDWRDGGQLMGLCSVVSVLCMLVSVGFLCVNTTEFVARKFAIVSCTSLDVSALFLIGGLCGYYFITKNVRDAQEPDPNGVVTTWTFGASALAAGLAAVLNIGACCGAMASKPPAEDEGMQAAIVNMKSPEVKYQMQKGSMSPAYGQQ